jgi:hypothetical protein
MEAGAVENSIAVWLVNDRPVRLVWHGRRYRVNDTPTVLAPSDVWWPPLLTHLPDASWRGWRFQAVDDDGSASVFDIRPGDAVGEWVVLAVHGYDLTDAAHRWG